MEGNQMKMREALDAALRFIGNLEIEPYSPLDEAASELRQRIMDALSAPARNCDLRYYNNSTIDECSARAFVDQLRYCEKYGACSKCPVHSENGSCLAKYLLSPAEGGAE